MTAAGEGAASARSLRVLILEDRPQDAELMLHELRKGGFEPEWKRVDTRTAFLDALDERPDLILSDYTLPSFDGMQAVRIVQERAPDTPIILVSGMIGEEQAIAAMQIGAADYLQKDRLARLGPAVERALAAARTRAEAREATEALAQSERRFRALIENSAEGVGLIAADATVLLVSPTVRVILGYQPQELAGARALELVHPEDRAAVGAVIARVAHRPGESCATTGRLRHKDGSWRELDAVFSNRLDVPGLNGIVLNFRDVTERERSERLLAAVAAGTATATGEAFLRALVRNVAIAVGIRHAFIGRLAGDGAEGIETIAMWSGGRFVERFECAIAGTPCKMVFDDGAACFYPRGVSRLFPEARVLAELGAESYFGQPLRGSDGRLLGVLALIDDRPMGLAPGQRSAVEILAARAAAELERIQTDQRLRSSEAALQRANRAYRVLAAFSQALVHAIDERSLLAETCRIACELGGYRFAWIAFVGDDDRKTVRPVAHAGHEAGYIAAITATWANPALGRGPMRTAIHDREVAIVRRTLDDPRFAPWSAEATKRGFASAVALPLRAGECVLGGLAIYSSEADAFDAEETRLLGELADDLAFGIMSVRNAADRAQAEKERRRADRELQTILDHAGVGIAFLRDRRIVRCNRELARMFGYREAELRGETTRLLYPSEEEFERCGRQSYPEVARGSPFSAEIRLRRKDGTVFPAEFTLTAIDPSDLSQGAIWVVKEIGGPRRDLRGA
jgi:PAS domain S-box-containing protein